MALTPWGSSNWSSGPWSGFGDTNAIAARGWESSRVGVPTIQLSSRFLLPVGIPPRAFGFSTIRYGAPRLTSVGGIAPGDVGAHTVKYGTLMLAPASLGDVTFFGTPAVSPFYFLPSGWDSVGFGAHNVGFTPPYDITLFPLGFDSSSFGLTAVDNFNREIFPQGWLDSSPGFPPIIPFYPQIRALQSISSTTVFGMARVENAIHEPVPGGMFTEAFGVPLVQNFIQFAFPTGIFAEAFGTTLVEPNPRFVLPVGITPGAFGVTVVTLKDRPLFPVGIDSAVYGNSGMAGSIFRVDNATPTPATDPPIARFVFVAPIDVPPEQVPAIWVHH